LWCSGNGQGYSIKRSAYDSSTGNGGQLYLAGSGLDASGKSARLDTTPVGFSEVNAAECISDTDHFARAIASCKVDISQLSDSCPAPGIAWKTCSDFNYKYAIDSWNADKDTGGMVSVKIPNGLTQVVARSEVDANTCVSTVERTNLAINECTDVVVSCPSSGYVYVKRSCGALAGTRLLQQNEANYYVSREGYNSLEGTGGILTLFYKVKASPYYVSLGSVSARAIDAEQCVLVAPAPTEKLLSPSNDNDPVEMHRPVEEFSF
jgi:hypothetical protein